MCTCLWIAPWLRDRHRGALSALSQVGSRDPYPRRLETHLRAGLSADLAGVAGARGFAPATHSCGSSSNPGVLAVLGLSSLEASERAEAVTRAEPGRRPSTHFSNRASRVWAALPVVIAVWFSSYFAFLATHIEVWPRDGRGYLIVPLDARWLYYLYRPLMHVDGVLTGMRFHIGPHDEPRGSDAR